MSTRSESAAKPPAGEPDSRQRVLIVATNPLAHRRIFYSSFLDAALAHYDVEVWSIGGAQVAREFQDRPGLTLHAAPEMQRQSTRLTRYLSRLNDIAWDYKLAMASKLEAYHLQYRHETPRRFRILRPLGWLAARLGLSGALERWLRRRLKREAPAAEVQALLAARPPDLLVVTWPHSWQEQLMGRTAARLDIPVIGQILSFDNLSTKGRFHVPFERLLVWSSGMQSELARVQPTAAQVPVEVIGAAQFDPFFDPAYRESREAFCERSGLDPTRPVVLFTLGSPRFLDELPGAIRTAEATHAGRLGAGVQLLIRPHPLHDYDGALAALATPGGPVVVQTTARRGTRVTERHQARDQIVDWVNTFRHADVVVNLASSTSLDAALAGRPVVNIDFEPAGTGRQATLIESINHRWPHFRPLNDSGGVRLVADFEALYDAIRRYLEAPGEDAEARRAMTTAVLGPLDGQAGRRTAEAYRRALGQA